MSLEYLYNKRILLTGGTGFLGQHILKALEECIKEHGTQVTCLVRQSSKRDVLPSSVIIKEANLGTGEGLDEALEGQDMVIHAAALLSGVFWQDYFKNVRAASLLGQAIARHKIERVVLISSLAASGPMAPFSSNYSAQAVRDDVLPSPISAYGWSKYLSEEALGRHCGDALVILRPPIIYGSGDKGLLPYFKSAAMGLVVSPGMWREFPVSLIHGSDMANAVLCALKPEAKGVYHCNDGENAFNEHYTMKGLGLLMAEIMGKKAFCVKMPHCILALTAACSTGMGAVLSLFGKRMPSWTFDKYRESRVSGWMCNGQRFQEELGFEPKMSLQDGLQETYTDYKNRGWL